MVKTVLLNGSGTTSALLAIWAACSTLIRGPVNDAVLTTDQNVPRGVRFNTNI